LYKEERRGLGKMVVYATKAKIGKAIKNSAIKTNNF
jgi:hypothetical protein